MSVSLLLGQSVQGTISAVDAAGNPSTDVVAGSLQVSSSDVSIVTVAQDPSNEFGITVTSVAAGAATISFSATNSEGSTISGSVDFTVSTPPNPSVALIATFGTPQ